MRSSKNRAILLRFNRVSIKIPRKRMLIDLGKTSITHKEFCRYKKFNRKVESATYKLNQVSSIIGRILLKSYEYETYI